MRVQRLIIGCLFAGIVWIFASYLMTHGNSADSREKSALNHNRIYSVPPINIQYNYGNNASFHSNTDGLVEVALNIFHKHGLVLFTMINDAYYPFTESWLCNTESLGIHSMILILTTDFASSWKLQNQWPSIKAIPLNISQYSGDQEYSHAGYVRMMFERTREIKKILESGVELLLFEVDCVWLANPIPNVINHKDKGDMIVTQVSGQDVVAGGFILLTPSKAVVQLWQQLTANMEDLIRKLQHSAGSAFVSESLNDQQFLTRLIKAKYAGVRVTYLPPDLYPDGKWYNLSAEVRQKKPRPLIINNNWVIGNAQKINRAKRFGHWFLNDSPDAGKCNLTAVKAVLTE